MSVFLRLMSQKYLSLPFCRRKKYSNLLYHTFYCSSSDENIRLYALFFSLCLCCKVEYFKRKCSIGLGSCRPWFLHALSTAVVFSQLNKPPGLICTRSTQGSCNGPLAGFTVVPKRTLISVVSDKLWPLSFLGVFILNYRQCCLKRISVIWGK